MELMALVGDPCALIVQESIGFGTAGTCQRQGNGRRVNAGRRPCAYV
jgi:hypothetical protein